MVSVPVKVFYHIYCNEYTFPIMQDQVTKLHISGLYAKMVTCFCFVVGDPMYIECVQAFLATAGEKFVVAKVAPHDTSYERVTLLGMMSLVEPHDQVLYLHTKGVTHQDKGDAPRVHDWRTLLEYFVIGKHQECLAQLERHDAVSINWLTDPAPHFSGNMWWCRGAYYLSLDPDALERAYRGSTYLAPEMFIGTGNPRVCCLHSSHINHYAERYPFAKYCDS